MKRQYFPYYLRAYEVPVLQYLQPLPTAIFGTAFDPNGVSIPLKTKRIARRPDKTADLMEIAGEVPSHIMAARIAVIQLVGVEAPIFLNSSSTGTNCATCPSSLIEPFRPAREGSRPQASRPTPL
jgi:hypothetical protein